MSVVTGVSISTLRYYDKERILTMVMRNEKRIKESLGYMSPREYRQSLI